MKYSEGQENKMDATLLEEQFERVLALIPVVKNVEQLEQIATRMDIDMTDIAGDRKALLRKIMTYLNSEDFETVEDRERLILTTRDSLLSHLGFMPELENLGSEDFYPAHGDGREGGRGSSGGGEQEGRRSTRIKEDSHESDDGVETDDDYKDALANLQTQQAKKKTASTVMSASVKLKDFKISGTVGEPGEKGKLTYGSLLHQIDTGIDRGFDETEVIAAVVHAITPGHTTRTYLEGKRRVTLAKLKSTLKAHFGVKNVTDMYKEMTTATQGVKQTPVMFLMSMFALRDRVLELSQQNPAGESRYGRKLVQSEMQKGIYAGLRDESIRQDMKMMLRQPDVDDDELLKEMTSAVLSKEEHERKLEEAKRKSTVGVSMVCSSCESHQQTGNQNSGKTQPSNMRKKADNTGNSSAHTNFIGHKASNQTNRHEYTTCNGNSVNQSWNPNSQMQMDPFVAQLTSAIGLQVQGIVEPLKAQVNELMGFKQEVETARVVEHHQPSLSLNVKASEFQPKPAKDGESAAVNTGAGNGASSSNMVDGMPGGYNQFAEFLMQAMRGVQTSQPSNMSNNQVNQGRGRGYGPRKPFYQNKTGNGNVSHKCSQCVAANAWFCNHCLICHEVDHKTYTCPKKNDPNFIPKN